MVSDVAKKLAKTLWDYHLLHHKLTPADGILVLGSHDKRVGKRAAEVFLQKLAPWVLFSGASGNGSDDWAKSEAETFADIAHDVGVPREKILIENKSTNTGENIQFSYQLLKEQKIFP